MENSVLLSESEAGEYWNRNANVWTKLAREGYDVYRDHVNTPGFFRFLPDVSGKTGLDIGCGEGYNTRILASKAKAVDAIDISPMFIGFAKEQELAEPLGIRYAVASATQLPFPDQHFDFIVSQMCMMDLPEPDKALAEAFRVLKPGGFFQFSITHPCFNTPHRRNLRNERGITYAIEVGNYFQKQNGKIEEWIFRRAENENLPLRKFQVPVFNRTLSEWVEIITSADFILEALHEPGIDDETLEKYPALQDSQIVAYFLHFRCRRPA
ncbi:class I SAM-dependent methyltransferase [Pollutibacter soli]|uniref:class I SAM-dependent methyltransferase n=1 Tax=Pollutibacter soli TaxID=3034157 RepID=UPI0030138786